MRDSNALQTKNQERGRQGTANNDSLVQRGRPRRRVRDIVHDSKVFLQTHFVFVVIDKIVFVIRHGIKGFWKEKSTGIGQKLATTTLTLVVWGDARWISFFTEGARRPTAPPLCTQRRIYVRIRLTDARQRLRLLIAIALVIYRHLLWVNTFALISVLLHDETTNRLSN